MSTQRFLLPSDLARAGRALAQISVDTLASGAELEPQRLRAFEQGIGPLSVEENEALRRGLEEFGVVFLPEDDRHGYGVRQKYNTQKVERLEGWENEGGPAGEDDI